MRGSVIHMSENRKQMKLFISHSSQDMAFVHPLVDLFGHIGLTPENMFCSAFVNKNLSQFANKKVSQY